MLIFNSLERKKVTFRPLVENKVSIYVCGVTVYDYCHLGHARTFVSFDMVVRYLKALGYKVQFIRNITDVDDKILHRARREAISVESLVESMTEAMHRDFDALNLLRPTVEPKATEHIDAMQQLIARLLDLGIAYINQDGDVLFAVNKFPDYGILSGQQIEQLEAGYRISNPNKACPHDFVLWKRTAEADSPNWASPWGVGRPGWHIECSAMADKYLGAVFDIHGGGGDLKFPHHENERAQSMASGVEFAKLWMHTGMVEIKDQKMSKSLDNFIVLRDLLREFDGDTLRLWFLQHHYRSPLSFSRDHLIQARSAMERLYGALPEKREASSQNEQNYEIEFHKAMQDDFNTPEALAILFKLVTEIHQAKGAHKERLQQTLYRLGALLGLFFLGEEAFWHFNLGDSNADIDALIHQRNQFRREGNWQAADQIRDNLLEKGVVLEDHEEGTIWKKGKGPLEI